MNDSKENSEKKEDLVALLALSSWPVLKFSPADLIKDYGWDAVVPIFFYFGAKNFLTRFSGLREEDCPQWIYPALAFALPSAGEMAQRIGLYSGTYDPKDFVAYAFGAGAAFLIEKAINKNKLESKVAEAGGKLR